MESLDTPFLQTCLFARWTVVRSSARIQTKNLDLPKMGITIFSQKQGFFKIGLRQISYNIVLWHCAKQLVKSLERFLIYGVSNRLTDRETSLITYDLHLGPIIWFSISINNFFLRNLTTDVRYGYKSANCGKKKLDKQQLPQKLEIFAITKIMMLFIRQSVRKG